MPTHSVRTIYFDVGGTILHARPSVGAIYADAAKRLGYTVDEARVNANFRGAWKRSLERRAARGHVCDDDFLRADWCRIVVESFAELLPEDDARRAFADLYDRFCNADAWELADGAIETFEALRAAGLRLGILSNWDARLETTLESLGILGFFEHRVVSYAVGVEKPHVRIFEEALHQAGEPAHRVLHVGDSFEWDIAPARALGIQSVWLHGGAPDAMSTVDDVPDGVTRVAVFRDVLPAIRRLMVG